MNSILMRSLSEKPPERLGQVWEDLYDSLVAQTRANEPRESLETVKKHQGFFVGRLVMLEIPNPLNHLTKFLS